MPTLKEVKDVIKKARAASAPGSNGITYKVYKNCPRLTVMLWKIIQKVWKRGEIVASWKQAEGCFIPKKDEATTVDQFRTISLLNVEGKICLAVLATRITQFWLDNKYIDTSVQKGGVPGVSGCLEHTSAVSQQIQEAKENHGDLAILWLDLANAYGSIPHKLVELTLKKYHIPQNVQHLLKQYFDGFYLRFTTRDFTTNWQRLEVGIVTGCTISVILFSGAMNLLMKSVEKYTRGPMSRTGISQPPTRGFMDDMTITCKTVVEARWTLEELGEMITWARMKFKPAKSRSLVLKSGKLTNRYKFKIQGDTIPTLSDNPVKALGKWYRPELNDQASMKETQDQLRTWMNLIGKSGLPGRYKAWIYQHGVLPRIVWPLMVYEFPLTTVEAMERVVNGYIKKWLGIPKSFSSVGLYSVGNKLQLPFSSLVDVYKTTKARTVTMLKDSSDTRINQAGITVKTGRKEYSLHVVGLVLLNAAQIVLTPPAPRNGGPFLPFFWAGRPSGPAGWLALLLLKAGDVETNPGPKHTRTQVWICDICHREITRKQTSLRCNHSEHWVHLRCAHIRVDQYTDTWICHLHRGSRLPHATYTSPHFPLASSKPLLHSPPTPPTPPHPKHQHTSNSPMPPPKMINPRLPKPLTHSPPTPPTPPPAKQIHISHKTPSPSTTPRTSSRHARQMLQNVLYRLAHHPQQTPR